MTGETVDRSVWLYLGGVLLLAGGVVVMLTWLFLARIPAFTDALVREPVAAVRSYPVALAVLVAVFLGTLLLVGLVVGFGVRYGPDESPKKQ